MLMGMLVLVTGCGGGSASTLVFDPPDSGTDAGETSDSAEKSDASAELEAAVVDAGMADTSRDAGHAEDAGVDACPNVNVACGKCVHGGNGNDGCGSGSTSWICDEDTPIASACMWTFPSSHEYGWVCCPDVVFPNCEMCFPSHP
jgi:hypothetical protein